MFGFPSRFGLDRDRKPNNCSVLWAGRGRSFLAWDPAVCHPEQLFGLRISDFGFGLLVDKCSGSGYLYNYMWLISSRTPTPWPVFPRLLLGSGSFFHAVQAKNPNNCSRAAATARLEARLPNNCSPGTARLPASWSSSRTIVQGSSIKHNPEQVPQMTQQDQQKKS